MEENQGVTSFGPNSIDRSWAANFLAVSLSHRARYAEAETWQKIDKDITLALVGSDHVDYAVTLTNMAVNLDNRQRYLEAEPLYREALAIWQRNLGVDSSDLALAMGNLARNLDNQGRLIESEDLYRMALAIRRGAMPSGHPSIATNLHNLAIVLTNRDQPSQALDLLAEAAEIRLAKFGSDHPEMASTELAITRAYAAAGRDEEAAQLFGSLLERRDNLGGWTGMASLLLQAADFFDRQGDEARAEALLLETIERQKAAQVSSNLVLAIANLRLARLARSRGNLREAEARVADMLSAYEASGDRIGMLEARQEHALILRDLGRYEEAIGLLEAVDGDFARQFPEGHLRRLQLHSELAQIMALSDDPRAVGMFAQASARAAQRLDADFALNSGNRAEKDRYTAIFEAELAFLTGKPEMADRAFFVAQQAQQSAAARIAERMRQAQTGKDMQLLELLRRHTAAVQLVEASEVALSAAIGGKRDDAVLTILTTRVADARKQLAAAREALHAQSDERAQLAPTLDLAAARQQLGNGEVLMMFYEEQTRPQNGLHVFILDREGIYWNTLDPEQTDQLHEDLALLRQAALSSTGVARGQQVSSEQVQSAPNAVLNRIRQKIGGLGQYGGSSDQQVFTVANGELSAFPLSLLVAANASEIVETRLPSASSLGARRPAAKAETVLGIALSQGGDDLPELPFAKRQIEDLALFPWTQHSLLLDNEAEYPAIAQAVSQTSPDLVVFATHSRRIDDRPELVIADGSGGVTGLSLEQITQLELDGALVVLSACDTATSAGSDQDALSSFAWAFFAAGARGVVISHWPLDDAAGNALTGRFVEELRKAPDTPEQALAKARQWFAAERADDWGAPFYWSALSYVRP